MATVKSALSEAFKDLRRQGFIARQSFLCCRTCAGAILDNPKNQGRPVVYYTRQDAEDLAHNGQVYLAYGKIGGLQDKDYLEVGLKVLANLITHGLKVEWDCDPNTRILVKGLRTPMPPPAATYLDLVGTLYTDAEA